MQEAKSTKKDIRWINYIRAICVILIYYIHAQEFFEFSIPGLAKYIFPVYVNAFFFVSGYLMFKKLFPLVSNGNMGEQGRQFLKNILFRLVIASLVFSIIEFIPSCLFSSRKITILGFLEKTVWGNTYWFISALVIAELLLFLLFLTKIKNIGFYFISSIGLFIIGKLCINNNFLLFDVFEGNPWYFEKGLVSVIFLVLGGAFWKYESIFDRYLAKPHILIMGLLIYISSLSLLNNHVKILISMNSINVLGVLISIIGILLLVYLCKYLKAINKPTNLLNVIGQNTIGFYFVCGAIPKALTIILPKFLPKGNLPYMLFGFVASFVLACIAVSLMTRFAPLLFDLRFGLKHKHKTNS